MYARINAVRLSPLAFIVRTSAASAAAVPGGLGSLAASPPPNVLAGPPTLGFGFEAVLALVGTEALVAGAGAEPRVRPGPSKPSLDSLPQRLPIDVSEGICGWYGDCKSRSGGAANRGGMRRPREAQVVGKWLCVP